MLDREGFVMNIDMILQVNRGCDGYLTRPLLAQSSSAIPDHEAAIWLCHFCCLGVGLEMSILL